MPELRDALPPLYRDLLGEPFGEEIPPESKATCASCAMLEGGCGGAAVPPVDGRSRFFRPDTKCCTFHPRLPNYLLGSILSSSDPALAEGRRRIESRIATRVGVSPEWLHPPRLFSLLYDSARGAFGRARGLRCPFYEADAGGCTIWAHRDAVCSTYFCKYAAGADGRRLWTAVKELLSLVEIQLARAALLELAPRCSTGSPGCGRPSPHRSARRTSTARRLPRRSTPRRGARGPAARWSSTSPAIAYVSSLAARDLDALLGLDGRIGRRAVRRAPRTSAPPPCRRC